MQLFESADTDASGAIDFEEFITLMVRFVKGEVGHVITQKEAVTTATTVSLYSAQSVEEDDEAEEIPEDLRGAFFK